MGFTSLPYGGEVFKTIVMKFRLKIKDVKKVFAFMPVNCIGGKVWFSYYYQYVFNDQIYKQTQFQMTLKRGMELFKEC